jgi:hypothetical protein
VTYSIQQGPWTPKQLVSDYLAWDLPRRITAFRNEWQMDDERLPTPEYYLPYEPPSLDHWPTVITVQLSTSEIVRADYSGKLNPIYRCTYAMRTYVWLRATSPEGVTESRDRLTAVIRSSLLDRPCFAIGTSHSNHEVLLDETSLREEYSDITYVKGDRAVAGAYLSYNVQIEEIVARADIAELTQVQVQYDASGNAAANIETELDENVLTQIIVD